MLTEVKEAVNEKIEDQKAHEEELMKLLLLEEQGNMDEGHEEKRDNLERVENYESEFL